MSILDTAEYRRLALIAAGVDPSQIPCILDTATWRRLMLRVLRDLRAAAGYVNGSVRFYADLPVTVGTPGVNIAYLVRESSGVWFINRRPAGIYVRLFNNGDLGDWDYAGAFPEVNDAQYFRIYDSADPTREVAFDVSGVDAGTTRTLTVPNASGTLALTTTPPATHASTHHTGGTDAIAPNNIGAAWALETRAHSFFTTSTYTLTQGRNVQLNATVTANNITGTVTLPRLTTDGAVNGDELFIVGVAVGINSSLVIQRYIWTGSSYIGSTETVVTSTTAGAWRFRLIDGVWTPQPVANHTHGNITNDGKIGSTSGLPVVTTTDGAVTTLALGTANQVLRVNSGATGVEFGAGFDAASPPAIGSTTPNSGAFTTLNATDTTHTFGVSDPVSQTELVLYGAGGPNRLHRMFAAVQAGISFQTGSQAVTGPCMASGGVLRLAALGLIRWGTNNNNPAAGSDSIELARDADDTLAQRRAANPQTFRLYNTFTDANNHERGFMRWSSNVLQIGTEKAGTGSARALALQVDGTTRLSIATNGSVALAGSPVAFYYPGGAWAGVGGAFAVAGILSLNNSLNAIITADAANIIAIRNGATGQTFRVYNKDGANFERGKFAWDSDILRIGTEKGGTGTARPLEFQTDSVTRLTLGDAGGVTINSGNLVLTDNDGAQTATFDAQSKLTANRTYDLPDASGVIALTNGSNSIWIAASAWIPKTTAGCGVDSRELATNDQNFDELLFDTGSDEFADALVVMPSNYNNGTVTARFYWTASSGSGGVAWAIQGRAFANDDALDTAAGTAQLVTDTLITANDMHITSATSAVTIGGTPAANTPIQFTIYRDVSDAGDDLGVDARLLGVEIIYTAA